MLTFTKMKKDLYQKIEIPQNVEAKIDGAVLTIKGPEGEISRRFNLSNLDFKKENNYILIGEKKATKKEKKIINTISSHIKNMILGVEKKFEYRLKICFNHFPISVEIKGKEVLVKNFLGEKVPRKVKIPEGAEVEVDKEIIIVKSINKEIAGQTAANFETSTRIRKRDRRIFQDGIWITQQAGKEL